MPVEHSAAQAQGMSSSTRDAGQRLTSLVSLSRSDQSLIAGAPIEVEFLRREAVASGEPLTSPRRPEGGEKTEGDEHRAASSP